MTTPVDDTTWLHDATVLVTGGTSGIGRAVALAFARGGSSVVATGVSAREIENFANENPDIQARWLDVTNSRSIEDNVARLDRLNILIHCAGAIRRDNQEFDPATFAEVVDVNLVGMLRVCSACRPLLARAGGAIVNLASMLSFFGSKHVPAYSASKGGVVQLTRSLAIAWAEQRIRVNAVAPGWIVTPMTQPLFDDPARRQSILDRTPMRRWGTPEDVVGAVMFLCSPAAAFITGAVLPVDGGYSVS